MRSWIKSGRGQETDELMRTRGGAYKLLHYIGLHAWRGPGLSPKGLSVDQAVVGDWQAYGMTRGQYRHALKKLKSMGHIDFRTTRKGTIVTLLKKSREIVDQNPIYDDQEICNENNKIVVKKTCSKKSNLKKFSKPVSKIMNEFQLNIPKEEDLATPEQNRDGLKKVKAEIAKRKAEAARQKALKNKNRN